MRRPRLPFAAFVFATLALAATALPVAAGGTPPPSPVVKGTVGAWTYLDTEAEPSALCGYDTDQPEWELDRIAMNGPKVKWPNRKAVTGEHGTVAWWVVIETSTDGGATWQRASKHPTWKETAKEGRFKDFGARLTNVAYLEGADTLARVRHELRWLRPDGSVLGSVRFWSSWYETDLSGPGGSFTGWCSNGVG